MPKTWMHILHCEIRYIYLPPTTHRAPGTEIRSLRSGLGLPLPVLQGMHTENAEQLCAG